MNDTSASGPAQPVLPGDSASDVEPDADLERRFGGLRRLWGEAGYARVRAARIAVVGVGGVGSWAVEALARCGVAGMVLIDLDQVAESNINRQVQALGSTVGAAKVDALRDRIADIHPGCDVRCIEEFVEPSNWPALLPDGVDVVIDACDQAAAKFAMAAWALSQRRALVVVGAAGGKSLPQAVEVDDLARVTHDPLLATLRQRLRKAGLASPAPSKPSAQAKAVGLSCVFSRESVMPPLDLACATDGSEASPGDGGPGDGSLNCHGYGSVVSVTATFGMAAAAQALMLVRSASSSKASVSV